jgi:hypothetical protein
MIFFCNGCGQNKDFRDCRLWIVPEKGTMLRYCKICRTVRASVPDVYWDAKPEENLADDPRTERPRVFSSKGEKAAYLKSRGLMEAGDRVHGAPVSFMHNQNRKVVDSKAEVQAALQKVKKMSPDYRRQEFLKIVKEGQNRARD